MMLAHRRREVMADLDRECEQAGRSVVRSVLAAVLGADPPDGDLARRYNLHLGLRGRTGDELRAEVDALSDEGFERVYLVPHS